MATTTHVILAFEGFNHPFESGVGRPIPQDTPDNRVVDILNKVKERYCNAPGEAVKVRAFATDMDEMVQLHAKLFIKENLSFSQGKQTGKVLIYGYSMGGDTAVELAENLNKPNWLERTLGNARHVNIDLLITVDAATFNNFGIDRKIPANVKRNENFWTDTPETSFGQKGGKNTAIDKSSTIVNNHKKPGTNHASISKSTKEECIDLLVEALKGKD